MASKRVGCSPFLPNTESDNYIERDSQKAKDKERESERENKLQRERDRESVKERKRQRNIERQSKIEYQRATVTTGTVKESDREGQMTERESESDI